MTTRQVRDKHKAGHVRAGGHSGQDHVKGQRCLVCRPLPKTPEQRVAEMSRRVREQAEIRASRDVNNGIPSIAAMVAQSYTRALNAMTRGSTDPRQRTMRGRFGRRGT